MPFQFAFIIPTTDCRAHCAHCFYETGHTPRVEAADFLGPLDGALDSLVRDGLQQIILTGGEPLLSPGLEALLEIVDQKMLHVLLITKGHASGLLDQSMLQSLEEWGVDDITLSAGAVDEDLRQSVQRVLFHSRYLPTLLCCLTRENLDQVTPLIRFARLRNLPQLFTPAFIPEASPLYEALSLRRLSGDAWQRLLADLEPWSNEVGSSTYWQTTRDFYRGREARPSFCPMGTRGLVVDADGSVYPCFHRHDLKAGNLLQEPWPQIQQTLEHLGPQLADAPCFGEHCLSMFVG